MDNSTQQPVIIEFWLDTKTNHLPGEVWRPITGFPGYEVSNYKRIKSTPKPGHNKRFGQLLKPHLNGHYYSVSLYRNGRRFYRKIHKLYAIEFIPNPYNKRSINHKNGIKTDLSDNNLEWCTLSENQKHAYRLGLQKPKFHRRIKIIRSDSLGNKESFDSVLLATRSVNPNAQNGSSVIRAIKANKLYNNFKFEYA